MDTTLELIKDASDPNFYSIIITHDETGSARGFDLSLNEYKQLRDKVLENDDSNVLWYEVFKEFVNSGDVYSYNRDMAIEKLKQKGFIIYKDFTS